MLSRDEAPEMRRPPPGGRAEAKGRADAAQARRGQGSAAELLVFHPLRLSGIGAHAADLVVLVILEVAFEEFDMRLALEGEDVGAQTVEEEAVVRDDDRAAGEILDRRFERLQRFHVEVVRRFVEEQHVAARFQQLGHVHAVAFTARKQPHLLLLVGALEIERADIAARVHRGLAELDQLGPARDLFPDVLLRIERVARLVDIGELHRLADGDGAGVGRLLAGDHLEQRRLAGAVRADHTDDRPRRDREREILDQLLVAVMLRDAVELDHLAAKARAVRDDDLRGADPFLLGLVRHLLIGRDTRLRLRLTRLGAGADPLEFLGHDFLLGLVLARFLFEPLRLLLEPGGVVALVGDAAAALELENPRGDVVEEVAVVGDDQDRALVLDQVLLQPGDGFGVEVVGRFVEEQHVGRLEQQLAQRHAAPFTAREGGDIGVIGRAAQRLERDVDLAVEIPQVLGVDLVLQPRHLLGGVVRVVHRELVVAFELGGLFRDTLHDVLAHGLGVVELRLLRQIADLGALGGPGLALEVLVDAGHDLQERRLTGAVHADDADLHAGQEVQADVLEAFLAARIGLRDAVHVIDVLIRGHSAHLSGKFGFSAR
ncbi:hypothetical protein SDC9_19941 [bioreactor metagenome]|uniref:NAD-specific glutamate dehydrogenase n=1 Tax=bioreactor metagenome TaxID=1076179 RepID=A0A644U5D1_9ZZZZ